MLNGKKLDTLTLELAGLKKTMEKDVASKNDLQSLSMSLLGMMDKIETIRIDLEAVKIKTAFDAKKGAM